MLFSYYARKLLMITDKKVPVLYDCEILNNVLNNKLFIVSVRVTIKKKGIFHLLY